MSTLTPRSSSRRFSVSRVLVRSNGSHVTTGAPVALQSAAISTIGVFSPIAFTSIPGWGWNPVIAVPLLSSAINVMSAR